MPVLKIMRPSFAGGLLKALVELHEYGSSTKSLDYVLGSTLAILKSQALSLVNETHVPEGDWTDIMGSSVSIDLAEIKKVPGDDLTFFGASLKSLEHPSDLANLLNREYSGVGLPRFTESEDISDGRWRIQRGYDQDGDETVIVYNGTRWVTAYRTAASDWSGIGLPPKLATVQPVPWAEHLESLGLSEYK